MQPMQVSATALRHFPDVSSGSASSNLSCT
jgi:hypothetical protein